MITSQKTGVVEILESGDPIPAGTRAYLCARTQNKYFDYVHSKLREAEAKGLRRSELARRIGKSPTRLSHILASPGNWTLDTVTELLIGICLEEPVPSSAPILSGSKRNMKPRDIRDNIDAESINIDEQLKASATTDSDLAHMELA